MSSDLAGRLRSQQGNTMLLMPVAVLVLFMLAAVAVDAAVLFLGQRRLADLAASVAQDAIATVREESFYQGSGLVLDGDLSKSRGVTLSSSLPQDDALIDPACEVATGQSGGAPLATVSCTARIRFVFTPAVPGARNVREVAASETAVGRQG